MPTIKIPQEDAREIIYGSFDDYGFIKMEFVEKHRWYNLQEVVFKLLSTDKFYIYPYMEPATEYQDGQETLDVDKDGMVKCFEVEPVEVTTVEYRVVKDKQ